MIGGMLAGLTCTAWGQQDEQLEERAEEREPTVEPLEPFEEITAVSKAVETLKERAKAEIEKRRKKRKPSRVVPTYSATLVQAYESNPNLNSTRKGDAYTEERAHVGLRLLYAPFLTQEIGDRISNLNYYEFRDNNLFRNVLYTTLRLKPVRWLRAETGYELQDLQYPERKSSTRMISKVFVRLRHLIGGRTFHRGGWSYESRQYHSRKVRDPTGDLLNERRQDDRHRFFYEIGIYPWDTSFRVRQDFYEHTSNESFLETFDSQVYRVRASVGKKLFERIRLNGSFSYQRRNYHRLPAVDTASYDDTYTYAVGFSYKFTKHTSAGFTFRRSKADSNSPASEYTNSTSQIWTRIYF